MRFCFFSIGGVRCALPIDAVREVLRLPETTPVPPGTPVVALAPLRGRVLTVIDRSEDLGSRCSGTWLLLLESEGRDVALLVDDLPAVEDVESTPVAPPPHLDSRVADVLAGVLLLEAPVHVLDLAGLVGR